MLRTAKLGRFTRLLLTSCVLGCLGGVASAEDDPKPPAADKDKPVEAPAADPPAADPPGTDAPTADAPPAAKPGSDDKAGDAQGSGSAPTTAPGTYRPRPPDPPPPGTAIPNWDLDHLSGKQDLPPALPKPDPFGFRNLPFRHDTELASVDGRIKAVKRIPQWVDIIERDEIQSWRPYDLGVLARRRPNVMVADGGNPFLQIPNIRGFGRDRVRIMTDGVWPGTQPLGLQGNSLSLWDPETTERMEIYHGPGAYLRAIDAPGGLINIVPRRPRRHGAFSADWSTRVGVDSATGTFRIRQEVDAGEDRFAVLGGVTYTTVGDRETANGELANSSYQQFAGDVAADYFVGPASRIGFTAQYMRGYNVKSPAATGSVFNAPEYERLFLGISLSSFGVGDVFHGSRMSIALDSFIQKTDTGISGSQSGISGEDGVNRFDFNIQGNLYIHPCHQTYAELSVGYATLNRTETLVCVPDHSTGGEPCIPEVSEYTANELVLSLMLTDEYHDKCMDTYLGLRIDYFYVDARDQSENKFLIGGSGGIAYHWNPRFTTYANASFGRRRPTIFERSASEIINGRAVFGNQNLDPETHANGEVGIKSAFKNRLSLQAAAFGHYTDKYILPVPLGGTNISILDNVGDAYLYGGELAVGWRPLTTREGLEFFGTYGVTRSTDTSIVGHVPHQWRVGSRYSVPAPKGYRARRWFAELAFYGASNSAYRGTGGSAYQTADLLLGLALDMGCSRVVNINFGLTNLLDEFYVAPRASLPSPGRSLFAGMQVDI